MRKTLIWRTRRNNYEQAVSEKSDREKHSAMNKSHNIEDERTSKDEEKRDGSLLVSSGTVAASNELRRRRVPLREVKK